MCPHIKPSDDEDGHHDRTLFLFSPIYAPWCTVAEWMECCMLCIQCVFNLHERHEGRSDNLETFLHLLQTHACLGLRGGGRGGTDREEGRGLV